MFDRSTRIRWVRGAGWLFALTLLLPTPSSFAQEHSGFEKWLVHWVPAGAPEIVDWAQTPFGPVLAYTNSDESSVVFLDLAPVLSGEQPVEIASLSLGGEPTSLATTADQRWFIVAVDTSDRDIPDGGSGEAVVISTYAAAQGSPTAVTSIPLPGQPDSVATAGAFNRRRGLRRDRDRKRDRRGHGEQSRHRFAGRDSNPSYIPAGGVGSDDRGPDGPTDRPPRRPRARIRRHQ